MVGNSDPWDIINSVKDNWTSLILKRVLAVFYLFCHREENPEKIGNKSKISTSASSLLQVSFVSNYHQLEPSLGILAVVILLSAQSLIWVLLEFAILIGFRNRRLERFLRFWVVKVEIFVFKWPGILMKLVCERLKALIFIWSSVRLNLNLGFQAVPRFKFDELARGWGSMRLFVIQPRVSNPLV